MKSASMANRPIVLTAFLAFGFGCLVLLPFLGRPLISREQELRVVLTARDMVRGGDWLVPHYLGEPRLNKPPLQYWSTAWAFRVAGTSQSPFAARLPTALMSAVLLAALAAWGTFLVGRRRALSAAVIAATSVLFWRFGRLAETDMPLALFETLAVLCLLVAMRDSRAGNRLKWWLAAGAAAGLGFMTKGPAALVMPAAAVLTYVLTVPRGERPAIHWAHVVGALALCGVITIPWYAYVMLGTAGHAAAADVTYELNALGTRTKHAGSPLFYFFTLPVLLMPWGLLLPFAVVRAWRLMRRHPGVRMILCWMLSSLAIMSLVPSKQAHYTTLLLAPSVLLIAVWTRGPLRRAMRTHRGRRITLVALILLVSAFWSVGAIWQEFAEPVGVIREVAARLHEQRAPGQKVFLAGRRLNSLRYYADVPVEPVASLEEGLAKAAAGDLIVMAADERNRVLPDRPPLPPLFEKREGKVTMQLYRKPAATPPRPSVTSGTTQPPES